MRTYGIRTSTHETGSYPDLHMMFNTHVQNITYMIFKMKRVALLFVPQPYGPKQYAELSPKFCNAITKIVMMETTKYMYAGVHKSRIPTIAMLYYYILYVHILFNTVVMSRL